MSIPFLDRGAELGRLTAALGGGSPGLVALYGRRRCGKSTLLQRVVRPGDVYVLADQSEQALQIRTVAEALDAVMPGFSSAEYPTWDVLFRSMLARASRRFALMLDEFPYMVQRAPELPSTIQRLVDRAETRLVDWVLCGSSQRMMHGLVLNGSAPLYGRAREILKLSPLKAGWIMDALGLSAEQAVDAYAVWGGIPRYWELASEYERLDVAWRELALDRHGVLHEEPQRLLLEEMRSAVQARSLLMLIGGGCGRLSEIAARMNRPAVSLVRPLGLLIDMGLVRREMPWGESTRSSKRSVYRLADPFMRFYFRFVAPRQSLLELGKTESVADWVTGAMPGYVAEAWEDLARESLPSLKLGGQTWDVASRWWGPVGRGETAEIDVVAESVDGKAMLLGEVKGTVRAREAQAVAHRLDALAERLPCTQGRTIVKALWARTPVRGVDGLQVIGPKDVMGALR